MLYDTNTTEPIGPTGKVILMQAIVSSELQTVGVDDSSIAKCYMIQTQQNP